MTGNKQPSCKNISARKIQDQGDSGFEVKTSPIKPKKNSPEYKQGKKRGYKNGLSKKRNKLEKVAEKIQTIILLEDEQGSFIPYCSYWNHPGVVGEQKYLTKGCNNCNYLVIYRPS